MLRLGHVAVRVGSGRRVQVVPEIGVDARPQYFDARLVCG